MIRKYNIVQITICKHHINLVLWVWSWARLNQHYIKCCYLMKFTLLINYFKLLKDIGNILLKCLNELVKWKKYLVSLFWCYVYVFKLIFQLVNLIFIFCFLLINLSSIFIKFTYVKNFLLVNGNDIWLNILQHLKVKFTLVIIINIKMFVLLKICKKNKNY